jgi:hypothetical protein
MDGSCRKILDRVIALNEEHLSRLIRDSIRYRRRSDSRFPGQGHSESAACGAKSGPPTRPRFRCRA